MGLLHQGCQCEKCFKITRDQLQDARTDWKCGKREVIFEAYHHSCSDGCCDDFGTRVYINGFNLGDVGDDTESFLEALMEFLEIDGVDVRFEFDEID